MVDTISKQHRSWNMSRIRSKNTRPELKVRSAIHREGYRYSLHNRKLPGKPDLVLKKYKAVVFIHGCFWHHHKGCKRANLPKSNRQYWLPKIDRNVGRDKENRKTLKKMGWKVIIIWECQTKNLEKMLEIFRNELKNKRGKR